MLIFTPIDRFEPGDLTGIIRKSYAALIEDRPEFWLGEAAKWDDFDRQAFAHPDTIGECVFVSSPGDGTPPAEKPVGLASYDPRQAPRVGIIGQNCILPEFRGRGFGKEQIVEVLRRFRERHIAAARVTTSEHPFFRPALRMYQGLGFREIRRYAGGPDPRFKLIELEFALPLF